MLAELSSKEDYCRYRKLTEFNAWVKNVAQGQPKGSRKTADEEMIKRFFQEALPLWTFFKNEMWSEDVDVTLSCDNGPWDAVLVHRTSRVRTEIQIATTYSAAWKLTQLHLNEHGDAPGTHEIQTAKELAEWKSHKGRVLPIAVDTRLALESELDLVADRIKKKAGKDYKSGMDLLVYSYHDLTEEHFSEDGIRAKILARLGDTSLDKFSKIYVIQPRRNVRIK